MLILSPLATFPSSLPFADLNLCDFDITGHHHKDNGFTEVFLWGKVSSLDWPQTGYIPGLFEFMMFLLPLARP